MFKVSNLHKNVVGFHNLKIIVVIISLATFCVHSRPVMLSDHDKLLSSQIAVIGVAESVEGEFATLNNLTTIKGSSSADLLVIKQQQIATSEVISHKIAVNQTVVVFGQVNNGVLYPVSRGVEVILSSDRQEMISMYANLAVLTQQQTASEQQITDSLSSMIDSPFSRSKNNALEFIYLNANKNQLNNTVLRHKVVGLLSQPEVESSTAIKAMQVLRRIGDKDVIPLLIKYVGIDDRNVSQTALSVFQGLTGYEDKGQANQDLLAWWQVNQQQVRLRY